MATYDAAVTHQYNMINAHIHDHKFNNALTVWNSWKLCSFILILFQKFVVLGWVVGPALLISMIFGPTKKEFSPLVAVLYTGLGKTAWSLGIAWFIIACATGRGGIINRILSAKCLLPYSRMTYTAYLINPLCIMFVIMSCEAPMHLDFASLVSIFSFFKNQFILLHFIFLFHFIFTKRMY